MRQTVASMTKSELGAKARSTRIPGRRNKQRGVAAVELALILPLLVGMLALTVFFSRVFWHYTAAQKAAHDTARYVASVPMTDMHWSRIAATVNVAQQILDEELAELNPGEAPVSAFVLCDGWNCDGLSQPDTISVRVRMNMSDPLFGPVVQAFTGEDSLLITAVVHMSYVGR